MALNGTDLADEIVEAYVAAGKYDGLEAADITVLKADMAIMCNTIVAHIVAKMAIKNVEVSDPSATVEVYTAGVGSNGGTLTGQIPVVGNVKKASQTLNQSNSGLGLVE